MSWPAKKVSSADTVSVVADFKEPQRSMKIPLMMFAAIVVVAWFAIAWDICRSLNWL
jgi:hypothetical protein